MDDDRRPRQNMAAAIIVIMLAGIGTWALLAFKHSNDVMDCYAAHLRNCEPVKTSP